MVVKAASRFEMMLWTAAREIRNESVIFVGFHWPMIAARIARRLHAPDLVVVYENGVVEDRLTPVVPTSPCDLVVANGSPMCASSVEALYFYLGAGMLDAVLLEAPNVDRFGNVNTSVIGDYTRPAVRLPGSGGGTELAALGRNLILIGPATDPRHFPERVDYVTSPGYLDGGRRREELGYPRGSGPSCLITPLGRFVFDLESRELVAAAVHAGVTRDELLEASAGPCGCPRRCRSSGLPSRRSWRW